MGLNAEVIQILVDKGMSAQDIADIARASEKKADPTAAERQKRCRENKKRGAKASHRDVTRDPPIDRTHTPSPDISPDGESQSSRRVDDCETVIEKFNSVAEPLKLSVCRKLTPTRRKACQARIRNDGLDAILRAIERIPKSAFLRGETGNWGGANIEFLLRPDSVTKILEGKYDDRDKPQRSSANQPNPANGSDRRSSLARAIDEGLEHLDWIEGRA